MAIATLTTSCYSQNDKYYNSKYEFKDRAELVTLIDRIIQETDISDYKNESMSIQDFSLSIGDGQLIYSPISDDSSTIKEESGSCPEGFTNHGLFTNEEKIRAKVADIAAPVENCCPKVTIILDRGPLGVRICSKVEK